MPLIAAFDTALSREMRAGLERKYRIEVTQEAGDRYEYRLKFRVVAPKMPKGATKVGNSPDLRLDMRMTDYKAVLEGRKSSAAFIGGGEMAVNSTGLPNGINVTGIQGPVWMPMLSFFMPSGDEGPFDLPRTAVGSGLEWIGKGTLTKGKGPATIDIESSFVSGERSYGKLMISTTLDRSGWPDSAKGDFTTADGIYHFTLRRG